MKIAYVVLAHRYPQQVVRLVRRLQGPDTIFLLHLDSKMDVESVATVHEGLQSVANVGYLPRCDGPWGGWPIVQVSLDALQTVVRHALPADYVVQISGQCYPMYPNDVIAQTLAGFGGKTLMTYGSLPRSDWPRGGLDRIEKWHFRIGDRAFVFPEKRTFRHPVLKPALEIMWSALVTLLPARRRFPKGFTPYGGQSWWCLSRPAVEHVCDFTRKNPAFVRFFHHTHCADEIFFQTVLLNSPLRDQIANTNLHYVDWSRPIRPAVLGVDDLGAMTSSEPVDMFARKFDTTVDAQILDLLDARIDAMSACVRPA